MTRKRKLYFFSIAAFPAIGITFLTYYFFVIAPDQATQNRFSSNAHKLGLALRLYANDHNGLLPRSFEDLVPEPVPDRTMFDDMTLVAPGVSLDTLPLDSIVVRQSRPSRRGRIAVVTADGGTELRHQ